MSNKGDRVLELRKRRSEIYISAENFRREHTEADGKMCEDDEAVYERLMSCVVIIGKAIEEIEKQRVGRWIREDERYHLWHCSECGEIIFSESENDRKTHHVFCEKCGSRMGGSEE